MKSTAWLIGYFVALFPIMYAFNGTINRGLFVGIMGLIGAIVIELLERNL